MKDNTRGQASSQIGDLAVGLFITLFVVVTVFGAIPTSGLDASSQSTLNGIRDNALTGFTLMGVLIIVIAAAYLRRTNQ